MTHFSVTLIVSRFRGFYQANKNTTLISSLRIFARFGLAGWEHWLATEVIRSLRVPSQKKENPENEFTKFSNKGPENQLRIIAYPKGPKIEKFQDRPPGLKFSSEIENFKRAAHQTPIFCGEF